MSMAISKKKSDDKHQIKDSMRTNYIFGFILFVSICSGTFLVVEHLMKPSTLTIKNVKVEGEFINLEPEDLKSLVSKEVRGGFFNVNVDEIKQVLLNEPWINNVLVMRIWPDTINVKISENVAVARWQDKGYLNREGGIFSPEKVIQLNLPVLSGPAESEHMLLTKYKKLQEVLEHTGFGVTGLELSDRLAWEINTDRDIQLLVGRDDFDKKIDIFLEHVYPNLHKKIESVELIDMRYTNGFSVKWRNENIRS
jgi:cell division protein FtsQ